MVCRTWMRIIGLLALGACASPGLYGLPVSSRSVVFLVDVSNSMLGQQEQGVWKSKTRDIVERGARTAVREIDRGGPVPGLGSTIHGWLDAEARRQRTKLAEAKRELRPAIRALPAATRFNVLVFSADVSAWRPALVRVSPETKRSAVDALDRYVAGGATAIGKALEAALRMDGVEEIFLITDAMPTDLSPKRILADVASLNADRRVRIHAVGIGKDQDAEFLRALAAQNGGRYVQRRE